MIADIWLLSTRTHDGWQIHIKTRENGTITIEVESGDTVNDLMSKIPGQTATPPSQQKLTLHGKPMAGKHVLSRYGISKV